MLLNPGSQQVSTPRAGHGPGEERALSWEAEALAPSPVFALSQQSGPGQLSALSGLLFLYPNHETIHLLSLRVCWEERRENTLKGFNCEGLCFLTPSLSVKSLEGEEFFWLTVASQH